MIVIEKNQAMNNNEAFFKLVPLEESVPEYQWGGFYVGYG